MRSSECVKAFLDRLRAERPDLAPLLDAFEPVLLERAALRGRLAADLAEAAPTPDPTLFAQGRAVRLKEEFAWKEDVLRDAFERLRPTLAAGFPRLAPVLDAMALAVAEERLSLAGLAGAYCREAYASLAETAAELGATPEVLAFILGQILRPVAEAIAAGTRESLPLDLWTRGHCPHCGSAPELSYLAEAEGKRFLVCSFCGLEWRYSRTRCPSCGEDASERMELYQVEGRAAERAESCKECGRYILGFDTRGRLDAFAPEAALLGLTHLDVLLQDQGLTPAAAPASTPGHAENA